MEAQKLAVKLADAEPADDVVVMSTGALVARPHREAREELANSITHGSGLVLSLLGAAILLPHALRSGDPLTVLGVVIYLTGLVGVYAASFLSHAIQEPRLKWRFRVLDQAAIFVMISGTYTPFAMCYLRDGWWWLLTAAMWGIALYGVFAKLCLKHRIVGVSLATYLLLGWLPTLALPRVLAVAPMAALGWLVAGGLCYTVGTAVLANDHKAPYLHSVWHLLVMAGSAAHFIGIYYYAIPM